MNKIIIFFALIFLISFANAVTINTFNNSLSSENITVNNTNVLRYLAIPQNFYLTNATINFSGKGFFNETFYWKLSNTSSQGMAEYVDGYNRAVNIGVVLNGTNCISTDGCLRYTGDNAKNKTNLSINYGSTGLFNRISYGEATIYLKYNSSGDTVLISRGITGSTTHYYVLINSTGGVSLALNGVVFSNTTYISSLNRWNSLILTWSATNNLVKLIINGSEIISRSGFGPNTGSYDFIGGYWDTSSGTFGNFTIDEFKFYDKYYTDVNFSVNESYTSKVNITAGNQMIFNSSGNFTFSGKTNDFSNYLNSYISSCTYINGYCNVPVNFSSISLGKIEYSSIYLTNDGILFNNISYVNTTLESSTNNFSLNVSFDTNYYSSSTATFYYNNTAYVSNKISSNNNVIFYNSIQAPSVNADTNITFYWTIALTNSSGTTYINSSILNQTVKNISITDCVTGGSVKLFNFTMYDEDASSTRLLVPTWNQTYDIELYLNDDLILYRNKTASELSLCSNVNITTPLYIDYTLRYDGDGTGTTYVNEYYNVQEFLLSNTTTGNNISLYSLKATSSDEFLITVKDYNYLSLPNALIEIKRKYISDGDYKIVEIPKTDSLGKAIGHFVVNDELYTINIRKNGILLATYSDIQLYCLTGADCTLNLNIPSASSVPSDFIGYGNLLYTAEYNDSTKIYTISFITNDGESATVNLNAYTIDNTNICSETITQSSGTLVCNLNSYSNQTIRITLDNSGSIILQDYVKVNYKRSSVLNPVRYIVASALLPFMVLMGASSLSFGIIFYILGIILAGGLFLYDTQGWLGTGSFAVFFIVGALILLIKTVRSKNNG